MKVCLLSPGSYAETPPPSRVLYGVGIVGCTQTNRAAVPSQVRKSGCSPGQGEAVNAEYWWPEGALEAL